MSLGVVRAALAFVVAVSIPGCASETADPGERRTVADSAGLRIVTNVAPEWTSETAWRLGDTPAVSIGIVEGAPAYQLFDVSDVAFLSDGRVVVGNAGTSELRVFDAGGNHVATYGGEGEGPGEFSGLRGIDAGLADSIFVWDFQTRRLSVFSAGEGFERSLSLAGPAEGTFPRFSELFADGSMLVQIPVMVAPEDIVDMAIRGSSAVYMRYAADGTPADTLGTFLGSRSMLKFSGGGGTLSVLRVPYEPVTRVATSGTALLEGDGAMFEIRRIGADGALELIIRRDHDPIPVTPDLIEGHYEENYGRFADQQDYYRSIGEAYAAMPLGRTVAAFDQLEAADDGTIWARTHPLPGDAVHTWSVFDADGRWLGEVDMPATLTVYQIGSRFVAGKVLDELEVERVVLYEIVRP